MPPLRTGPLNAEQIRALIPHRPPFLLVDAVQELEPGRRIVASKQVSADTGVTPGLPGTLVLEALAQAGVLLILAGEGQRERLPLFGAVQRCRFKCAVRPGDQLQLQVALRRKREHIYQLHGRAFVGQALACRADLTLSVPPAPEAAGTLSPRAS